jgi:vitamin B12 transporter
MVGRVVKSIIAVALCCIGNGPAWASDGRETAESALSTVVVTVSRTEESTRGLSIKPDIIDRFEIDNNHSLNLSQLLADHGVLFTSGRTTMMQNAPKIRGFGNNQTYGPDTSANVLLLINGRRSGIANFSKFPTKNIERIEIIRGPAAVQYGSSAIGGVVNVITRRGGENAEASVSLGAGSWGRNDAGGEFSIARGPVDFSAGVYYASMSQNYSGGNQEEVKGSYIDHIRNMSANIGYSFNGQNRLGLIISASDNKFGQSARNAQTRANPFETRDKYSSIDFVYDGSLESGSLKWHLQYFNGNDKYEEFQTTDPSVRIEYYKTKIQGLLWQISLKIDRINTSVTAGIDWAEYDVRQRATPNSYKAADKAFFLMAKTSLFDDRLFFSYGFRYDSFANRAEGAKIGYTRVTPTFGVAYMATEYLKLRANWTRGYRVPSVWESISDTRGNPGPTNNIIPNPNLKVQQATTWEAGVDLSLYAFEASLTYFHTEYKDRIAWVSGVYSAGGRSFGQYRNYDNAALDGIEFEGRFDVGKALDLDYSLRPYVIATYMGKYRDQDSNGRWTRMQNIPRWYLSWGVSFDYPKHDFQARLSLNTQTEQLASATVKTAGWTKGSLSFSKGLWKTGDKGSIRVFGQIDNMFDRDYFIYRNTTESEYRMPGRSFYLGVSYEYR